MPATATPGQPSRRPHRRGHRQAQDQRSAAQEAWVRFEAARQRLAREDTRCRAPGRQGRRARELAL